MVNIFIITTIWITLSILFGVEEARYFYYRNSSIKNDNWNPHSLLTIIRGLILIGFYVVTLNWTIVFLPLIFTFFHDGEYYNEMNNLDETLYPLKWWDQSTTSTSILDKWKFTSPMIRSILAIIGTIGIIYFNIQ